MVKTKGVFVDQQDTLSIQTSTDNEKKGNVRCDGKSTYSSDRDS